MTRVFKQKTTMSFHLCLLFLNFFTPIIYTDDVIRGEKTRSIFSCPTSNAHWYGPNNQTIDSERYHIKYSTDNVQLIIDYLSPLDQGEYLCLHNETNEILQRYDLKLGTIDNVLLFTCLIICFIMILIPIFWFLGKRYSGIDQ